MSKKGWKNEPARHALARKGVKTSIGKGKVHKAIPVKVTKKLTDDQYWEVMEAAEDKISKIEEIYSQEIEGELDTLSSYIDEVYETYEPIENATDSILILAEQALKDFKRCGATAEAKDMERFIKQFKDASDELNRVVNSTNYAYDAELMLDAAISDLG